MTIDEPTNPFYTSFYEIIFITKGKGIFKVEDEVIPFERGTVLLLPPAKWREWSKIDEAFDAIYLIFEEESILTFFNDDLFIHRLSYFFNLDSPSFLHLNSVELSNFLSRLNELKNELDQVCSDSPHLLRSILYYTLIKLNRNYKKVYNIHNEFYKNEILNFKKLLEKNIKTKHKVSDYAKMLKISASHLNKLLNIYFGKSCSQIIKARLIIEIKRHLLYTDKTISQISNELNFSEPSNFNRFFYNSVKITPKEFRSQKDNF